MQIDVSQLCKEPIGSTRQYQINETIDVGDGDGSYEVQGGIKLVRTDRGMLGKGTLHTEVEVTCSRCLSFFSCPLTLNIEEEYFPTTDIISGASVPLPEEPGYFTINERYVLDLDEAIRQYIMLAIPMKRLCRGDCAGICLTCGHNLNQGPCGCLPQEVDPRWSEMNRLTLANDA
jgi:uncharacterized protein